MKITVICNTEAMALPTIHLLEEKGLLCEVEVLERSADTLLGPLISMGIERSRIRVGTKEGWAGTFSARLKETCPDMVWVFGFPWLIPATILQMPPGGFMNFHFGLLPKYKGADPVFWQIRNREKTGGFVIQRMSEEMDEGPVVWKEEVPMIPGETYGLYSQRMGGVAMLAAGKFIDQYTNGQLKEQPQAASGPPLYWKKPTTAQLTVDWDNQDADEIEALVNASNPRYGGASVFIRNMEMRLLEVSPADLSNNNAIAPGTIVYADQVYGLIVACRNKQYLRINVVHTREGYLSGSKLFNMGIRPGEQFTRNHETQLSVKAAQNKPNNNK